MAWFPTSMTTPPFPAATNLPAGPPPQDWPSKRWKWFIPLIIFVTVVLFGLFVTAIYMGVTMMFRNSYPYQLAIQRATESPEVVERIGVPFHVGWLISGQLNHRNADGDVDMSLPISGAHGKGRIVVVGVKRAGQWTFETFEVDIHGQQSIPLLHPAVAAPQNTPVNST
jgi:hypothetical protein